MRPTVCICYIEANEPEALQRSLLTMTRYPWVTEAVVLHTNDDRLPNWDDEVEHVYQNYGYGFERQPEDGGFDEVAARNHMLRLGRATSCDWLLLLDADEFFLPCTIDPLLDAHHSSRNVVFFECWHFFSPSQYLFWPDTVRSPNRIGPRMHDPHIRAIRSCSNVWFASHPSAKHNSNRTGHCTPVHSGWDKALMAPGMHHIHTHHMFDPKRRSYLDVMNGHPLPLRSVRSGTNVFPQAYLDTYQPVEAEVSHSSSS